MGAHRTAIEKVENILGQVHHARVSKLWLRIGSFCRNSARTLFIGRDQEVFEHLAKGIYIGTSIRDSGLLSGAM
jgi:hypothetical protein